MFFFFAFYLAINMVWYQMIFRFGHFKILDRLDRPQLKEIRFGSGVILVDHLANDQDGLLV